MSSSTCEIAAGTIGINGRFDPLNPPPRRQAESGVFSDHVELANLPNTCCFH
jgi:hypothetical protein